MLTRFSVWLGKVSTGWVALAGLLLFMLFTALVLPGQSRKAEQVSGDAGSPDTSFFYSSTDLAKMADAYGELGRQTYVRARYTFDLIFPIIYTFFLVTSVSWVFGKGFPVSSRWQLANLTPLLGILCDYLENISASIVMLRYPDPATLAAALAPIFTLLKWSFIGLNFGLLFTGVLVILWQKLKSKSFFHA